MPQDRSLIQVSAKISEFRRENEHGVLWRARKLPAGIIHLVVNVSIVRLRPRLHIARLSSARVHNCCARLLSAYLLRACITSISTADRKFSRLIPLSFSEDRDRIQEGTARSRRSARVLRKLLSEVPHLLKLQKGNPKFSFILITLVKVNIIIIADKVRRKML